MIRVALMLSILALAACPATLRTPRESDETRCPESNKLICLTAEECSFDKHRGCAVCRCSNALMPPSRSPDANVPAT